MSRISESLAFSGPFVLRRTYLRRTSCGLSTILTCIEQDHISLNLHPSSYHKPIQHNNTPRNLANKLPVSFNTDSGFTTSQFIKHLIRCIQGVCLDGIINWNLLTIWSELISWPTTNSTLGKKASFFFYPSRTWKPSSHHPFPLILKPLKPGKVWPKCNGVYWGFPFR